MSPLPSWAPIQEFKELRWPTQEDISTCTENFQVLCKRLQILVGRTFGDEVWFISRVKCLRCQKGHHICSGEEPCSKCVSVPGRHKGPGETGCVYDYTPDKWMQVPNKFIWKRKAAGSVKPDSLAPDDECREKNVQAKRDRKSKAKSRGSDDFTEKTIQKKPTSTSSSANPQSRRVRPSNLISDRASNGNGRLGPCTRSIAYSLLIIYR